MFKLKKGMKVKNKFGNIHIFLEFINGEYWFENRTCNLEDEIDWEETAKLNGIDLEQIGVNKYFEKEYNPKYDKDKLKWTLLPINELEEIVKALNYGVEKYGVPNAWQGIKNAKERYTDVCIRHLAEYLKGNKIDSESGLSHLSHLATNIIFLMWFENNKD